MNIDQDYIRSIHLDALVPDAEIIHVHGNANFGPQPLREVVNEGVLKYAFGFTSGYTQLRILMEHGLVRTPKPGKYSTTLTAKGRRYFRIMFPYSVAAKALEKLDASAEIATNLTQTDAQPLGNAGK